MGRISGFGTYRTARRAWLLCPLVLAGALVGAGLLAGCQGSVTTTTVAAVITTASSAPAATTSSSTAPPTTTTTVAPTTTTVAPTTTTVASTTTTIPPDPKGWKRFTAGGISVVLPTSFKGGEPTSAALKAQVKKMADGNSWLSQTQGFFTDSDITWLLAMLGSSSKTRWIPMVFVLRAELYSGESFFDFTSSWNSDSVSGYTVELLEKTDTREAYIITEPKEGSSPAGSRLIVFIRSGQNVYVVEYSGTKTAFAQFKDVYKQSAARIRIVEGGTGTSGSTTSATLPDTSLVGV